MGMEGHSCRRATRDVGMPKGPGLGVWGLGGAGGVRVAWAPLFLWAGHRRLANCLPPTKGSRLPCLEPWAMDVLAGGEGYGFHRAQEPLPLWLHRTRSWIGAVPQG